MSLYTVTEPCVIGLLHYATVPTQPIEVDDELAAPLVEAGSLVPYRAGAFVEPFAPDAFKLPAEKPRSRSRKATED